MSRYSKNKMSNWVAGTAVHRSAPAMFITLLVALFMVMIGALPALAADGKIYPGSMGVRYAGTSTPTYSCSAIGNPSTTSWLYLDLPAVHDTVAGNINTSWVRVIDQHYNADISCQLCSVYRCGCGFCGWFSPTKYSSGSNCIEQVLSPGGVGANDHSHYYFSCKIPPRYNNNTSYIISYYVEED
jgi:hypothetical protein